MRDPHDTRACHLPSPRALLPNGRTAQHAFVFLQATRKTKARWQMSAERPPEAKKRGPGETRRSHHGLDMPQTHGAGSVMLYRWARMIQDDPTRQREMDGWMSRAVPGHTRASQPVHHHPCVRRLSLAPRRGRMVGRLEHRSERSPSPVEFVFWAGVSPGQLVVNRVNLPSQITVSCRRGGIWWGGVVEKQKHAPYLASRAKLMFFFPLSCC